MTEVLSPPQANGNPLVGLAVAVIYAILYVLDVIRTCIGWLTISLPGLIVRMLQYSFTISLTFPTLLAITVGGLVGLTFVIRYRYLARYTQLKEAALPPPSPETLTTELLPLATPGLGDRRNRSAAFHNYLDDFLAAIRIFGYLEKPVFHELSRHLQTRRLAAGDSIEIGGGEFWCVVEGRVQVFAPSEDDKPASAAADPLDKSSSFNGYHLLNEVSTGGTLSSLFSILHLFTEDIRLSWAVPADADSLANSQHGEQGTAAGEFEPARARVMEDEETAPLLMRRKPRQDSDVSQMEGKLGQRLASPTAASSPEPRQLFGHARSYSAGSNNISEDTTMAVHDGSTSAPETKATTPESGPVEWMTDKPKSRPEARPHPTLGSMPSIRKSFSPNRPSESTPLSKSNASQSRRQSGDDSPRNQPPAALMKGTIARATMDTTLAVIPSEAFRKLTRKFPKASGTVVQVVLERFSRVTFMTAHKFLGLTREILRSESSLNSLVSHPLPRGFYTGGGMQALRSRFEPRRDLSPSRGHTDQSNLPLPRVATRDYFNYIPASPTVKAPSLPSFTPSKATTPAALSESPAQLHASLPKIEEKVDLSDHQVPAVAESAGDIGWSPDTARRHNPRYMRQTSAMRKQVAAGDLAMSKFNDGEPSGAYYRKSLQTPGIPRQDTWRGRMSGSATDLHNHGVPLDSSLGDIEQELEIRDAVMICIAKSVGLIQPPDAVPDSITQSMATSVGAASPSAPNSPMFPPNNAGHVRGGSKSPFGNVLDMMNASTNTDNVVSGMLREAVMASARVEDDMSVMSASPHESGIVGNDMNRNLLKDLEGCVEILFFQKGTTLVKEGERSPGIYYVIDGFLDVSIPSRSAGGEPKQPSTSNPFNENGHSPDVRGLHGRHFGTAFGLASDVPNGSKSEAASQDEHLYTVQPGGLAGYLASLCSTDSYVNIRAKTDSYVGFLPMRDLERILERRPIVLLTLAKRLLSLVSPLVLHIDAGLDWMQLSAGQVLYEKGDRSNDIFIVINGRLRSVEDQDKGVKVLREYGQSDTIGELDVITAVARSDTVHAIRDSELVRIPAALFDAISVKHPATTVQFMRLIAGRVKRAMGEQSNKSLEGGVERGVSDVNLKTVCILGTNRNVPVSTFAARLKTSLEDMGASTSYLDQGTVMRHLGRHAFARIGQLKIAGWLADQEQHYRTVLYVADTPPSSQWTLTCIRQADLVLILAMGDDPVIGEYEKLLLATKTTARKELILLHDERSVAPGSTRHWLRNRPWVHAHYHVELPGVVTPARANANLHDPAALAAFKHLREQVETRIKRYRGLRPLRPRRPPHMNDFARIARRLCGKQIGVVLGGGGGRGISHIGMLQALEEYGIPVDAISGCSIGAFVGGLYARGTDLLETTGRTKQFSGRMGSMLRILSDVTYPFVAYTTGHEFNRGIYKAFYNTHIEDFWLPFFANSTNITHSRMEIHRAGYAWRYVRASMTLAGLLPPLSDHGELLVDGGYMDNTPIAPLRANGIRDIFVIDVGSVDDTSPRNYGDSVSGWWIFINKLNPFYKRNVLSMTEVSSRLVYVSSVKVLDDVKKDPNCLYLAMPVQQFETLGGFKKFQEVLAVGLQAGREALKNWKEEGKLPTGLEDEIKGAATVQRGARLRRMSI